MYMYGMRWKGDRAGAGAGPRPVWAKGICLRNIPAGWEKVGVVMSSFYPYIMSEVELHAPRVTDSSITARPATESTRPDDRDRGRAGVAPIKAE